MIKIITASGSEITIGNMRFSGMLMGRPLVGGVSASQTTSISLFYPRPKSSCGAIDSSTAKGVVPPGAAVSRREPEPPKGIAGRIIDGFRERLG